MSEPGTDRRDSRAEVADLIRARYPLLYLVSHEESRVEESLRRLCIEREMRLEVWSVTEGFRAVAGGTGVRDVKDPLKALEHVVRGEGRALYVLRDFHPFLKEPSVVRRLRDLANDLRKTKKSLLLLSPVQKVPPELEKSIAAMVYWELPRRHEIEAIARRLVTQAPEETQRQFGSDSGFLEKVVEAALGLTEVEAENVFAKSMVRTRTFDIPTILEEKKQIIRKSGLLEYYEQTEDVGKIFAGLVGSSEENIRNVTQTAEAIAPSVLWIDEIEKGFSGTGSSNMSDGGTTSRVFGSFITWLQEKRSPVFVIATANNVHQLPPELLRKGRFDEIFFCDLPSGEERKQIFDIHLRKKNRDPSSFDLDKLVTATGDYSGAEVEQAVVAALYDAFDADGDLTTERLLTSL